VGVLFFYLWWRLALAVTPRIPRRLAYAVSTVAAEVAWFFWPRRRRREMAANFRRVLGPGRESEATSVAHRSVRNYFKYLIDLSSFHADDPAVLDRRVLFDGWKMIEEAHARKKGLILALMHFGFWEIGGSVMVRHGYPMNAVAEPLGHPKLDDLIQGTRLVQGIKIIPLEKAATGVARALKKNETVALLIDRPVPGAGVPVDFFGARTEIPGGVAMFAVRTGAPVLACSLVRLGDGRILALVEPIDIERTADTETDIRLVTQRIMSAHERVIRRFPDQWYKFRAMWPELREPSGAQVEPGVLAVPEA